VVQPQEHVSAKLAWYVEMAKSSLTSPQPRVLILDPVSGGFTKTGLNYASTVAFYRSCNCHVEEANTYVVNATDTIFDDDWDLIVVVHIGSTVAQYTQLNTVLGYFRDTSIPVFIEGSTSVNHATAQPVTGITGKSALGKFTATELENWESRQSGLITFYAEAPTTDDGSITKHASNSSNTMLWSKTVNSHPTLQMCGYSNSAQGENRPWLGAQWMVDQQSDITRKQQLKDNIRKRYCLLRFDGLGDTVTNDSYVAGHLDTIYASLLNFGVKEVWLATIWTAANSSDLPATDFPAPVAWYAARSENSVGDGELFRVFNHETDVVDGIRTFDGNTEGCTSDGAAFDQFKSASYSYKLQCDQLTDAGFIIGTDGYGKDYPNVQNANNMNNPSAKFLSGSDGIYDTDGFYGGFGTHLWVNSETDTYPTGETNAVIIPHSILWYEGRTLDASSQDATNPGGTVGVARTFSAACLKMFINGGCVYYHGNTTTGLGYFADYSDEYGQMFTTCPDILSSGTFEDMLADLKLGTGIWFEG